MASIQPDGTNELLWASLRDALLAFVRRRVPSKEIAEDIVHDVLLKISLKIDGLRDEDRIQAWAFRIARNAVADYYRAPSNQETKSEPIEDSEQSSRNEDLTSVVASWLPRFLSELPAAERSLLEQVELEGVAQKTLAQTTGIPYSSLKSKVQRARGKLKSLIEECCRIDFDTHGNVIEYRSKNCDC